MDGGDYLNVGTIMHQIYSYSKKITNLQDVFQENLRFLAKVRTFKAVDAVLKLVENQLELEKKGIAPFVIDAESIL